MVEHKEITLETRFDVAGTRKTPVGTLPNAYYDVIFGPKNTFGSMVVVVFVHACSKMDL